MSDWNNHLENERMADDYLNQQIESAQNPPMTVGERIYDIVELHDADTAIRMIDEYVTAQLAAATARAAELAAALEKAQKYIASLETAYRRARIAQGIDEKRVNEALAVLQR